MEAIVILLLAVIIALCIPKPDGELRGETPAEQAADLGKGCGTIILGIVAFAVVMALITLAGDPNIHRFADDTRMQQQRAGR